jgi:ribosomal subunit interface protein
MESAAWPTPKAGHRAGSGVLLHMINPQITYRGMTHSPAFDQRIRELADKLEEFNPKITSCHVIVDECDRHKRKGKHFQVRVDVHVPGAEIVASLKENEDPYIAATEAFHVLMRQLDEDLDRKRGEVKRHHEGPRDEATP